MTRTDIKIFAYDNDGRPTGWTYADKRPDGKPLIPLGWTEVAPPEAKDGCEVVWNGSGWGYVETPEPVAGSTPEQTEQDAKEAELDAQHAYLDDTDYMVIKCLERGLDIDTEYPGVREKRQKARERINELSGEA